MYGWGMDKLTAGGAAVVQGGCCSGDLGVDAMQVRPL
ncbi:hypothetical protein XAXN_14510 [Xanthomonas axonopodis]|uniref:Uncharacterized protein n=1 Tax=Xanthomonas axonopodis TaxID=53413 RepID=A0A0N8GDC1_9XANT|nr:hypothetical protein XAXN_14510 [Xanthomonas axonopodis]